MTYEVLGYETEEDFENRNHDILEDYLLSKDSALKVAHEELLKEKYKVLKVQSRDREFIQVLRPGLEDLIKKHGLDSTEVQSWLDGGNIVKLFDNPSNLCVLVEFKSDEKDKNPLYQFQRFFDVTGITYCSVDKEFHKSDFKEIEHAPAILISFETNEKFNK